MKISNSTTNFVNQAYNSHAPHHNPAAANEKPERNKEINPSASVDLSNRTKEIQKISQAVDNEPVEMSEKVSRLKARVDANQYTVDADRVAGRILGSLLDKIV